jgi:hypothetical protein
MRCYPEKFFQLESSGKPISTPHCSNFRDLKMLLIFGQVPGKNLSQVVNKKIRLI